MSVHFVPPKPTPPIPVATLSILRGHGGESPALCPDRTGVLVRLGNRHLLITAAHELVWSPPDELRYGCPHDRFLEADPLSPDGRAIELGTDDKPLIDTHEERDYFVLSLDAATVAGLAGKKKFLTPGDLLRVVGYEDETFTQYGHPFFLNGTGVDDQSRRWGVTPPCWFDSLPIAATARPDAPQNLFLTFPPDVKDHRGYEVLDNELEGFSGCGTWLMLPTPGQEGQFTPKLTGIFHHYTVRRAKGEKQDRTAAERNLTATRMGVILDAIRDRWPETADAVQAVPSYP